MAIQNDKGLLVSFNCDEIIPELISDIMEFGDSLKVYAVKKNVYGVDTYTNYTFYEEDIDKVKREFGVTDDEELVIIAAKELLSIMEKQNSIF